MLEGVRTNTPICISMVRASILEQLRYRSHYFVLVFVDLIFMFVNVCIWKAVFQGQGTAALIHGFQAREIIAYAALVWTFHNLLRSSVDFELSEMIHRGNIEMALLHPFSLQMRLLSHASGAVLFRLAFVLPILIIFFSVIFPFVQWFNLSTMIGLICSLCVAFATLVSIDFLVGLIAFKLRSINGIINVKYMTTNILSGLLLPFEFFPGWLAAFTQVLPFRNIYYVPAMIMLGKISGSIMIVSIMCGLIWCALLLLLGQVFLSKAVKSLVVYGG